MHRTPVASGAKTLCMTTKKRVSSYISHPALLSFLFGLFCSSDFLFLPWAHPNLKTYLIINVSKPPMIHGKPETKGRDNENWVCACLQAGTKRGIAN